MQHAVEGEQPPGHPRRLRAQQLGGVGVLLLGHQARARGEAVGHLAEPELLARPDHDLAAELGEVRGAGGGRGQVVEHEVAVGHGVERVLGDAAEAELLGHEHAAGVEVHAGQRAGAERQVVGGGHAEVEPLEVAPELPEVGQQVVREVDRLGALQVGVAGHRPVEVALGQVDQRAHQASAAAPVPARLWARTSIATSVATWSLRERAVCSRAPASPDDLGEPPLDRHVHVLVVGLDLEPVLVDLGADLVEAALDGLPGRPRPMILRVGRASARARATAPGRRAPAGSRTPIDEFSAWNSGSCGSEKRDMRASLRADRAAWARPAAGPGATASGARP